jgi:hypothetical protein
VSSGTECLREGGAAQLLRASQRLLAADADADEHAPLRFSPAAAQPPVFVRVEGYARGGGAARVALAGRAALAGPALAAAAAAARAASGGRARAGGGGARGPGAQAPHRAAAPPRAAARAAFDAAALRALIERGEGGAAGATALVAAALLLPLDAVVRAGGALGARRRA